MNISADRLVSIVIPVWQDRDSLADLLATLPSCDRTEIIVVVALDEALRYRDLQEHSESVRWVTAPRGRGGQMDAGAARLPELNAQWRLAAGLWARAIPADFVKTKLCRRIVTAGKHRLTLRGSPNA